MDYYIDPREGTKEAWLEKYGKLINADEAKQHDAGEQILVCWVDNGPFTVAEICYNNQERDAFLYPYPHPKKWYLVNRELLITFCPLLATVK